jgi:hypothetical protein
MSTNRPGWRNTLHGTLLIGGFVLSLPEQTLAEDPQHQAWISVTEENNNLGADSDHYYVNGFNASWLSADINGSTDSVSAQMANRTMDWLPWLFGDSRSDRRIDWTVLGQQIFTPSDKTRAVPDPGDRPYAGWLYTGVDLLQNDDGKGLDDLALTMGLVGPDALGRQVQNGVHKVFGFGSSNGWSYQLHDEPVITLTYAHKWRWATTTSFADGLQLDCIPEAGATLGNLMIQAESTLLVRGGWGLDASYGPHLLWPGMQGDGYFAAERADEGHAFYWFAGFQGRGVAHNLLLEGNTYEDSPSVARYSWVHEYVAGFSALCWRRVRLDLSYVHESEEFRGQQGAESYGSVTVSARW